MEILYISSVPSPGEFEHIKAQYKSGFVYGMNESGFKFHTLILNGMRTREDVNITSLVGRNVGSRSHRGFFWPNRKERAADNLSYEHLSFINLPVAKHLMVGLGFFFKTRKWLQATRGKERAIVMDAAYVTAHPFVLAARGASGCHVSAIFCDLYEYMADVQDASSTGKVSFLRRMVRKIAVNSYRKLDSFILLTEQMNPVVNKLGKPYIVMEGLVDVNMQEMPNHLENKEPYKTVMYAGALRAQYGLKNLVEGFMAYPNPDVRLWIFGAGDYAGDIEQAAQIDNRICFGGMIPLQAAVEKELRATVLVNARPADMEFARYSFPSKNMEYMVSGTPVLTTRLLGMPQEYYDYVYTIDGNTAADVTAALEKVLAATPATLHEKGIAAREFVLNRKNNVAQSGRILNLVGYRGKD
ncbi:MAG: glycosyltransferase [Oscillospiraceae bacterium]|nr:glycosyltransferase [Oscillospiraceae bacterium]